jgi:hypothetical protein
MNDPALDPSVLEKLYHSGAWLCLAILVVFFALRAAKTRIAWLKEDHRAVWVSAILGGLALLVVPATQGTTPNLSMLIAALVTVASLHADPKKTPEEQKAELPTATVVSPPRGFARLGLMIAIVAIGSVLLFGCSTGASRQSTLGYLLATTTAVAADMTPQNDALIQADIAGRAASQAAGDAALTKYEKARNKVIADVKLVLDAIGAAYQLNDDASLKTAELAGATLLADVVAMKGSK